MLVERLTALHTVGLELQCQCTAYLYRNPFARCRGCIDCSREHYTRRALRCPTTNQTGQWYFVLGSREYTHASHRWARPTPSGEMLTEDRHTLTCTGISFQTDPGFRLHEPFASRPLFAANFVAADRFRSEGHPKKEYLGVVNPTGQNLHRSLLLPTSIEPADPASFGPTVTTSPTIFPLKKRKPLCTSATSATLAADRSEHRRVRLLVEEGLLQQRQQPVRRRAKAVSGLREGWLQARPHHGERGGQRRR